MKTALWYLIVMVLAIAPYAYILIKETRDNDGDH
jgi:hypothetical protein